MSAIHLYVSNSETEIDCISVRESLICGSVPVLGNDYVFKERDGIHVSGSTDAKSTYQKAAITTLRFLKDQDALEKKRNEVRQSDTLISWEKVGQKWLDLLR
jgi:glycosyltransferase involved in cell wall biosynthesis